jgi:hypothetical protein
MVLVGDGGRGFISHIPMFHPPHDLQAVFEVELPSGQSFADGLYTMSPRPFSIDDLIDGRLTRIQGTLFRGNFESGGTELGPIELSVRRLVSAAPLDGHGTPGKTLEYLAFGTPDQAFMVHAISGPPDFDQVLAVNVEGSGLTADELAKGVRLSVPGRSNELSSRLGVGPSELVTADGRRVPLHVEREVSTLVGPDFVSGP